MRMTHWFAAALGMLLVPITARAGTVTPFTFTPQLNARLMQDIDGRKLAASQRYPKGDVMVRRRPWVASDDGGTLLLQNLKIHDVTNMKAMYVTVNFETAPKATTQWNYRNVILKNIEAYNINRDENTAPGLHMDFLLLDGWCTPKSPETNVTMEDVYFHDGDALTTLMKRANFNTITLNRVRTERTTTQMQFDTMQCGYIKKLIIENSPSLNVALMGRAGSIGQVIVYNSPGIHIVDTHTAYGTSGAKITYVTTPPTGTAATLTPVPEPGMVGLVLAGAMLLVRRRA